MTTNDNSPPFDDSPHWDLDQLYVLGSEQLYRDLELIEKKRAAFVEKRERLIPGEGLDKEEFLAFLSDLEETSMMAERLGCFAALNFSQDTSDQKAQSFLASIDEKLALLDNSFLFLDLWFKQLPQETAQQMISHAPDYSYWLNRIRAFKDHTLSEAEEKIINLKNVTGSQALVKLYDTITNSYKFKTDFADVSPGKSVSREELMVYVRSHNPQERSGAYQELHRVFGQDGPVLGQIYQSLVRDWAIEEMTLRRYPSPQSARNKRNDLRQETVDSLLRVCRSKSSQVFGEYFKLKAKRLGLKTLRRYDLYAPLVEAPGSYSFSEGLGEVEAAFVDFDPKFASLALNVPKAKHLSALQKEGKQSGAFCASTVPKEIPWVLMNYNGRRQDMFTLAHELGHAVHSQLACGQNFFHFHSSLPLAETASTFAEMLLAKRLMDTAADAAHKEDLAFHILDDAYATVGRQAGFALFEVQAHDMISRGATADELSDAYLQNLAEQFGDSVQLSEEFRWEWVSIPHFFHSPFYVYAYSFGQLLVYSLWKIYLRQGADFVPKLTSLLSKGGSASPEDIIASAGLGPLDDDFWAGGFDVIQTLLPQVDQA
ncbi:MAG: M3 family oligoendopeptidase [Deltaproteobacteria bacterium]|jgi:oligoendopeptidase F|nr:M3 family oligoendopeptidase [Deltaproteobacteria bacterium]